MDWSKNYLPIDMSDPASATPVKKKYISRDNIYSSFSRCVPSCCVAYDVLNGLSGSILLSLSAFTPIALSPNATASRAAPPSVIGTPNVSFVSFLLAYDIPTAPTVSTAAS